jgi:hypothetical protein
MELKNINNISTSEIIFESDNNNRIIKSYVLEDCQFDENKLFYPEVLVYSHKENNLYNQINERILSLEKLTIKKEVDFNLKKSSSIESSSVFYFIYNTENYYHFIYDTLPYLITFNFLKKKIPSLKLLVNYPNQQTNHLYKFVIELLEIIGVKKNEILFVNNEKIYKKLYYVFPYIININYLYYIF